MSRVRKSSWVCSCDPLCDFEKTVPNLAADVGEIMATNVVPSFSVDTPYSKETEISEIGHYVRDKIEGAIAIMNLNKSLSAINKSDGSKSVNPPAGE